MKKLSPALISLGIFFIFWEVLGRFIGKHYILPWPTLILKKIYELRVPLFAHHIWSTVEVAVLSLVISLLLGCILAVLMSESKFLEEAIYPLIVTSQTIPITALAPIFILWLGYSIWSKVLVSVIITFFPVTITIYEGLKSVDYEYLELFYSMNATKRQIFTKLKVPYAMPFFFSALKMSIPLVIIGSAIGEWLGATSGLGYFSKRMMTQLDGAGVFAPIVIISILAIVLVKIVSIFEKDVIKKFRRKK